PAVAAVRRLVDADAGLTAGRAVVALAGAEVERLVLPVGRVEQQVADGVLVEPPGRHVPPRRVRVERVVGAPDTAAGGPGIHRALVPLAASRRDGESRDAARSLVRRPREG